MEKLSIICVDDQREVLAALRKDLESFTEYCTIIESESADETIEVFDEIDASGKQLALVICDHVMPGKSGIDLLVEIHQDLRYSKVKKLLLTGLATHRDTITAINEAHIDCYIEKPWDRENLIQTVKELLTQYLCESGIDYRPYLEIMDQNTLYQEIRRGR